MGRAPLGSEGRTVQAGLKITKQEEAALTQTFGSPGKGLRWLLDQHLIPGGIREVLRSTPMAFDAEVGASVPLMSDEEMAAALALDQVKQSLPIREDMMGLPVGVSTIDEVADPAVAQALEALHPEPPLPGTIAAGLAGVPPVLPDTEPPPAPHRHRRGVLLETTFDHGTKVRTYACSAPGCPVVLT